MPASRGARYRRPDASIRMLWGIAKSPELRLEEEDLYAIIYRQTGKEHMKELTQRELNAVAGVLQDMRDSIRRTGRFKRTDEGGDPRTVDQRRKIYQLAQTLDWSEAQVNGPGRRMFGVERQEWLRPEQCSKLIEAMKAMLDRKEYDP